VDQASKLHQRDEDGEDLDLGYRAQLKRARRPRQEVGTRDPAGQPRRRPEDGQGAEEGNRKERAAQEHEHRHGAHAIVPQGPDTREKGAHPLCAEFAGADERQEKRGKGKDQARHAQHEGDIPAALTRGQHPVAARAPCSLPRGESDHPVVLPAEVAS